MTYPNSNSFENEESEPAVFMQHACEMLAFGKRTQGHRSDGVWSRSVQDSKKREASKNLNTYKGAGEDAREVNLDWVRRLQRAGILVRFIPKDGLMYLRVGDYENYLETDEAFAERAQQLLDGAL